MNWKIFLSKGVIQAVFVLVLLIIIGLALAFLLAPEKPEAPPRSKISYEGKPTSSPKPTKQYDEILPETPSSTEPVKTERQTSPQSTPKTEEDIEQEQKEFPVIVKVLDGETNQPIAGAQVLLATGMTHKKGPTITSSITGRDASQYYIESRKVRGPFSTNTEGIAQLSLYSGELERYRKESMRIVVKSGDYIQEEEQISSINIEETKPTEVVIRLYKGGTIEGKVVEEGSNTGASGIKIFIDQGSNPFLKQGKLLPESTSITDEEGNFKLTGLIPGTYGLYVSVEGTPYLPSKKEIPYKKVTLVSPKDSQKGIIFKVEPAGMIWGYIMNMSGEPVSGAQIMLTTSQSIFTQAVNAFLTKEGPKSTSSDSTGYYELGGVALNQEWRLYVTAEGNYTPQLSDVFALTPSYRVVRVDINMFDGGSVAGSIRDTDGKPVSNAEVLCMPEYRAIFSPLDQPTAFRSVTSQEDGTYLLTGLPPGNFQVMAWKAGFKVPLSGVKISSDGFSRLDGINFTLEPIDKGDLSVFGKVTNPQGQPLSGADVNLEGVTTAGFQSEEHSTTTDSSGMYRIDGVNIGYYELRVSYPGYVTRTLYNVRFNQPTDIVLQTFGVIRGQVLVKETGSPLEQPFTIKATPSAYSADESGDIAFAQYTTEPVEGSFTDKEGRFELELGPGAFDLVATAEEYVEGRAQVTVREGETVEVKIYVSKQGAVLAGKVTIRGGGNPQGTRVFLIRAESETEAMSKVLLADEATGTKVQGVGDDGAFRFEAVAEGNYVVVAQHEGYAMANSGLISLNPGQRMENITITLSSGGGLEGHIYIDGKLAGNAMVIILGPGGLKTTNADESGYYSFEGLSSGVYQLVASPVGASDVNEVEDINMSGLFETRGVPVEVKEGQTTRFDFGRMGGTRIEGRCNPAPPIGGIALLRPPSGRTYAFGQIVNMDELVGSMSTMVNPLGGNFVFEDVPTGEWQLDIYYVQFGRGVRYVYTVIVDVKGEEPVMNIDCMVRL
ncbi:MAG TPA: carboxypeptidase regulatory-like domain-containing protein [Candidatus Hydrogenedens sp.]|nr:carboxypeptidase regulatory-like domain-containing protein [Candidatus Hydrogenedens sp.]HOL19704.1 carboxypeptidase regulatory-like domain-containing protein [Candidatus Hydrogenedens sp.]HPP59948.1 carboxypeptidase regulatory-like domain-containing protein [Candidatus Hydrogenedens sp.]